MKVTDVATQQPSQAPAVESVQQPTPTVEMSDAEVLAAFRNAGIAFNATASAPRGDGTASNGHSPEMMAATWSSAHDRTIIFSGLAPEGVTVLSSSAGHGQKLTQCFGSLCFGQRCMADQSVRGKAPGIHVDIVGATEYLKGFKRDHKMVKPPASHRITATQKRNAAERTLTPTELALVAMGPRELREWLRAHAPKLLAGAR